MLFAPYTGIKDVAKDYTFLGGIMGERFHNLKCIKNVRFPVWFLHGKEDEVIGFHHSVKLKENTDTFCIINIQEDMTHNYYDLEDDLIANLANFLNKINMKPCKPRDYIDYQS